MNHLKFKGKKWTPTPLFAKGHACKKKGVGHVRHVPQGFGCYQPPQIARVKKNKGSAGLWPDVSIAAGSPSATVLELASCVYSS